MNSQNFSTLFLFSDYVGKNYESIILDKEVKQEFTNMYEERVKEFLNTWFIFSCKCNACCKQPSKDSKSPSDNIKNSVIKSFVNIFGSLYYENTLQHIIPRFLRFRHIIKAEQNPSFESSYIKWTDGKNVMKEVMSKQDDYSLQSKYKEIYRYYTKIINKSNGELINLFDEIVRDKTEFYLSTHSLEFGTLPYIEEGIFYNNSSFDEIREKSLLIFFEILCRLYESINIDIYNDQEVTTEYLDGFFKPQKTIINNDILYIFLRDSKSVLVYDFEDKLVKDTNEEFISDKCKYITIDRVRHIYLLTFENPLIGAVYNEDSILLILSDGSVLANGVNYNKKLSDKLDFDYQISKFIDFDISFIKEIKNIKICKDHIFITNDSGIIFIFGYDNEKYNHEVYEESLLVKNTNVYKNTNHKNHIYFSISENENSFIFVENENEINKYIALDNYYIEFLFDENKYVLHAYDESKSLADNIEHDFTEDNEVISDAILLTDNLVIIETKELTDDNFHYYAVKPYEQDLNILKAIGISQELIDQNEIPDLIPLDSLQMENDELDRTLRINKIISYKTRTIVLMSNGYLYFAGSNDGYFCNLSNDSHSVSSPDDLVTEITNGFRINKKGSFDIKLTDVVATRNSDKTLVVGSDDTYIYGFGGYYFVGMRSGSGFRCEDDEVRVRFETNDLDGKTSHIFYSYLCSKNCLYYLNPIYDLASYFYISKNLNESSVVSRVKDSLLYLKNMSITYNDDGYEHIVKNLTGNDEDNPIISQHISQKLHSNLQNYVTHDSMLLLYDDDIEKYSAVSKFINMIGLMAENYCAMKIKKTKIGDMDIDDFSKSISDINRRSRFKNEEKQYGIKFNPFRARS